MDSKYEKISNPSTILDSTPKNSGSTRLGFEARQSLVGTSNFSNRRPIGHPRVLGNIYCIERLEPKNIMGDMTVKRSRIVNYRLQSSNPTRKYFENSRKKIGVEKALNIFLMNQKLISKTKLL